LRKSTRLAPLPLLLAAVLAVAGAATPAAAGTIPALTAGATISVQYIPNEDSPLSYEMDSANHMSWMKSYSVPVQNVTLGATATLTSTDLATDHYVYRTSSDAGSYDRPPNPDYLSSYQFMPGAQYVTSHGDLNLVAGQQVGIVCVSSSAQALVAFQVTVQSVAHTYAAWISAAEWNTAALTGGPLAPC